MTQTRRYVPVPIERNYTHGRKMQTSFKLTAHEGNRGTPENWRWSQPLHMPQTTAGGRGRRRLETARAPQPRPNYSGAGSGGNCHNVPVRWAPVRSQERLLAERAVDLCCYDRKPLGLTVMRALLI